MPFTTDKPPKVALNWTAEEKEKCVNAANSVFDAGGDDQEAIFACIAAAGRSSKQGKDTMAEKHVKSFDFRIDQTKEIERDGKKFGFIAGHASTFGNIDRGNDRIMSGAFDDTIGDHMKRSRPIRMLFQHSGMELIGGFFKFHADEVGLFVEGEINLEVQRGREAFALAKQGVLSDMSIGFSIKKGGSVTEDGKSIFEIKEVELFEISLVGEPMNQLAMITDVKSLEGLSSMKEVSDLLKKMGLTNKELNILCSKIKEFQPVRKEGEESDVSRNEAVVSQKLDDLMLSIKLLNANNKIKKGDI